MIIYTDGGCINNPGKGAWAFLETKDDNVLYKSSGFAKETTNNKMELTAIIKALEYIIAKGEKSAHIHSDSQYVVKGITTWINGWKKNNWRTAGKDEVKNKDLWIILDNLNSKLDINYIWVKGHSGNHFNEICDSLVGDAIKNEGSL